MVVGLLVPLGTGTGLPLLPTWGKPLHVPVSGQYIQSSFPLPGGGIIHPPAGRIEHVF
jgi:hypothetical protein